MMRNLRRLIASLALLALGSGWLVSSPWAQQVVVSVYSFTLGTTLVTLGQTVGTLAGLTLTNPSITGTTTNDNACAGCVGEYLSSNVVAGSAVGLVTSTAKDITTLALTAGDWDVETTCGFIGGTNTTVTVASCSASTTLNTQDGTNDHFAQFTGQTLTLNGSGYFLSVPRTRFSLNATTTIHMVANAIFAASTLSSFGIIQARRVR